VLARWLRWLSEREWTDRGMAMAVTLLGELSSESMEEKE